MTESPEQKNQANFSESQSSQPILNRRQFIGAGAAAAAALILPKSAQADPEIAKGSVKIAQASTTSTAPSLTPPSDTSFVQPNVITSQKLNGDNHGTLTRTLNVVGKPYPKDSTTLVRAFEDQQAETPALYPGPTLCVNPGDLIELEINNNLDQANGGNGVDPNYCPNPMTETAMNTPHCFDVINMHFHGLHVSPISVGTKINEQSGEKETVYVSSRDPRVKRGEVTLTESSDDVLYELEPGGSHKYRPWLPAFHAPGTHWYHAHNHGSTAIQVAGGMVGALIIKEPEGQEICPGAADVVMIIQEEPQSWTDAPDDQHLTDQEKLDLGIYKRSGNKSSGEFHINGKPTPTLNVEQGEIHRWRIINANSTPRAFMDLELRAGNDKAVDDKKNPTGELQTIYRVAVDGITLYGKQMNDHSVELTSVQAFSPGNRVDLLVDFRSSSIPAGTYTLWKAKSDIAKASNKNNTPQALATIEVSTTDYSNAAQVEKSFTTLLDNGIPLAGRPAYLDTSPLICDSNNTNTNIVESNTTPIAFQANSKTGFTIDNGKYDPGNLANTQANLNSSQEWIVANTKGNAAHPFHIHVNPFLVIAKATVTSAAQNKINDTKSTQKDIYDALSGLAWTYGSADDSNTIDPTVWWDSFPIEKNTAYKIRQKFDDYWGNYVLHCHVLIHEDQGMMWNVQINDFDDQGANPGEQLLKPVNGGKPFTT
ncbi:MAG: multicopper oxidase domain-containing protein [Cyanobacteria bacterium P01_A01_bin.40]